jgi:predicted metal-dependent hydrolase
MVLRLFRRRPDPVDPTHLAVEHAGATFQVALRRRPASRRMTLRVAGTTGEIVLTLPPRAPLTTARTFLDAHGGWIAARIARVPERVGFGPGNVIPLRGVPHRIVHVGRLRGATTTSDTPEPSILVCGDEAGVAGRVRRYLTGEATHDLAEAVQRHTAVLGLKAKRITLRDTRSRWGSCSSTGALSFSFRLILAPPFVLDYLAAHEVAHLKEMNHSSRFWAVTHALCARTDEAEAWLKRHGQGLHRYG